MGRVEIRMYKQKRRSRKVKWLFGVLLAGVAAILLYRIDPAFIAERIAPPEPAPLTNDYNRTVEQREVTLAGETWYAIQTGVFSTQEAAVQKAEAYTERGAPGTVIQDGAKWRVFIACYGREADASAVQARLEDKQRVDTYLYAWQCPELRLRMTGMAGQIDAVEAGFTLLTSTANALRDTAMQMDAGQLLTAEVLETAASMNGQIALWEDTIHQRFGKVVPALVQGMLAVTKGWPARYEAIRGTKSATELSATLKAQSMGLYDELIRWRNAVAGT